MSVLVKGMEMPHSCVGCRFCEHGSINEWDLYCGIDNKHIGNWDDKHINNGWRRPDCPLVEVPTPHGRWIQNDNGTYSCSLCQSWIPKEQHYYARFCLYCGAKMDAEEGEEA